MEKWNYINGRKELSVIKKRLEESKVIKKIRLFSFFLFLVILEMKSV